MSSSTVLTAGLDIGNGWVKGRVTDTSGWANSIDIPSAAAVSTRPSGIPEADSAVVEVVGDDAFYGQLDVSFDSPVVGDSYRRLLGARALTSPDTIDHFDTTGHRSKVDQDLSRVLVLGLLAGAAVRRCVQELGHAPSGVLEVEVYCALALPIAEYNANRSRYAELFTGEDLEPVEHVVRINNFATPLEVRITFADVVVIAEGASAQYAIGSKGTELMERMLEDLRSRGMGQALEGVTAADVLAARNTIGIDIGEGTTNFPIFTDGSFNTDASTTFHQGYGTVLENALRSMAEQGFSSGFRNRKQLASFLSAEVSPMKRAFHARVMEFVAAETEFFARAVALEYSRVLEVVGATSEVTYVFGGGSGPVKEVLYPMLVEKVRQVSGMDAMPVLYLSAGYSRQLNREGLLIAASTRYRKLSA